MRIIDSCTKESAVNPRDKEEIPQVYGKFANPNSDHIGIGQISRRDKYTQENFSNNKKDQKSQRIQVKGRMQDNPNQCGVRVAGGFSMCTGTDMVAREGSSGA